MTFSSRFTLESDGEVLDGTLVEPSVGSEVWTRGAPRAAVVIMHGAGAGSQQRTLPLAVDFAAAGHRSVVFDFSGHGRSSGQLFELSLRRRQRQARDVVDRMLPALCPLLLIGFSMSGQTVADLLEVYGERVTRIALCAPAMYDKAAWGVPFGAGFTELIRRPESWRDTQALDVFAQFPGRAVLVLPEQDAVIPAGVTRLLSETLERRPDAEFRELRIAGSSHQLGSWLTEHPCDRVLVVEALLTGD